MKFKLTSTRLRRVQRFHQSIRAKAATFRRRSLGTVHLRARKNSR